MVYFVMFVTAVCILFEFSVKAEMTEEYWRVFTIKLSSMSQKLNLKTFGEEKP